MANTYDFDGQVALVTGGASGIGAAVAERLRAGGAEVHVFDLANGQDVPRPGARSSGVIEALPRLDVLVCAAGVSGDSLHTEEVSDEEWRRVHAINLRRRLLRQPRRDPEDEGEAATAGSSTSPRSPARRGTRWRAPTRRRRRP